MHGTQERARGARALPGGARRFLLAAGALAAAALIAGCGGSDDSDAEAAAEVPEDAPRSVEAAIAAVEMLNEGRSDDVCDLVVYANDEASEDPPEEPAADLCREHYSWVYEEGQWRVVGYWDENHAWDANDALIQRDDNYCVEVEIDNGDWDGWMPEDSDACYDEDSGVTAFEWP